MSAAGAIVTKGWLPAVKRISGDSSGLVSDSSATPAILSPFGAVVLAVLIEVVLAVVLLSMDAPTLRFLRMMHARFFLLGHRAVGLDALFDVFHMGLALLQSLGFGRGQAAGLHALVDALLLVLLPLVDVRRAGWRLGLRAGGQRQEGGGGEGRDSGDESDSGFSPHDELLEVGE
jgi:uncharacterized membrane protein YgcG